MKINSLIVEIDGIDKEILRYLMEDARKPILQIANKIGISGAAIHQRLRKLEQSGVISGCESGGRSQFVPLSGHCEEWRCAVEHGQSGLL
jgi:DNA-binding Lrp family transcriptional regulator